MYRPALNPACRGLHTVSLRLMIRLEYVMGCARIRSRAQPGEDIRTQGDNRRQAHGMLATKLAGGYAHILGDNVYKLHQILKI